MYTISNDANREIMKAKKALHKAIELLSQTPEYNDKTAIFHNSTVYDVNRLITASQHLND